MLSQISATFKFQSLFLSFADYLIIFMKKFLPRSLRKVFSMYNIHASTAERDRNWKPYTVWEIAFGHCFHDKLNKEHL